MLRHVLALFALLTGLAATSAHAEARLAGIENVRLEAGMEQASACTALGFTEQPSTPVARGKRPDSPLYCPRPTITVVVPTVMLRADRARE